MSDAVPPPASRVTRILVGRALRAFADGYVSLLLPFYLTACGHTPLEIGVLVTATLLGSGVLTLLTGYVAHRYHARTMLLAAAWLMTATGIAFSGVTAFWPLLIVAFVGTMNPSSGDVSIFLPLEQAMLAHAVAARERTAVFARYSLLGALAGAGGAQAAILPHWMEHLGIAPLTAMQLMFVLYAAFGVAILFLYRDLDAPRSGEAPSAQPLTTSRSTVYRLAALFSLDSFAGGFAVQSLLALWLSQRYGAGLDTTATVFFWVGLLSAFSQLVSPRLASRIGLVNTMVYTHLPANLFLIAVPFMPTFPLAMACLFARSALSQMDVPARTSYVMAVVSPAERAAAASVTAVPRSLAAAISPGIAGYLLAWSPFGAPLIVCGALKIVYDLLLLHMFSRVKPPEEGRS
ncbi:MAG: MFS transporter [Rhodospirillaceae bacterium]